MNMNSSRKIAVYIAILAATVGLGYACKSSLQPIELIGLGAAIFFLSTYGLFGKELHRLLGSGESDSRSEMNEKK